MTICGVFTVGLWKVVVENEGIPAAAPAMKPSVVTVAIGVRRTVSVA
jgi:hypothetical protein